MKAKKTNKTFRTRSQCGQCKKEALRSNIVSDFIDPILTNGSDSDSDGDNRRQIKYGTKYQAAWGLFSEYCENSTIHGIKYLGEHKRPILERIFWICVFVFSMYICGNLTMNIWNKWHNNPVIVSFAEKSTPVWQIPFPSVTVCTETKSRLEVFNFTDTILKISSDDSITEKENYYMEAISQVCLSDLFDFLEYGKQHVNASDLLNAMEETSTMFSETFIRCKWRNQANSCNKFRKVLTEEGLCYSFNAFDPRDIYRDEVFIDDVYFGEKNNETIQWNLENGYNLEAGVDTFPYRVLNDETKAGLFLILRGIYQENDQICRGAVHGFKIILTTPGEVPHVSEQYFPIPFNQAVLISIKPEIITTSDGLKHYEPMRRHCYFQHERYLRYFKLYTQSNCKLECLSNFTMKHCGCVKFSMPRTVNSSVCGVAKISCMSIADDLLAHEEFTQGLKTSADTLRGTTDCNCLPACTSITYNAEVSQSDYDYAALFHDIKLDDFLKKNPGIQASKLSIFFKESQFLTSKRSELYGTTDFIANCGGLLGLFMGVSTLSIVELVYFCTVRLLTNLRMRKRKRHELEYLQNEEGRKPEIDLTQNDAYE